VFGVCIGAQHDVWQGKISCSVLLLSAEQESQVCTTVIKESAVVVTMGKCSNKVDAIKTTATNIFFI